LPSPCNCLILVDKARVEKLIKIIAGRLKADKLKWIRGEFLAVIRFLNCEDEFDMNNQRFLHKETGCEIHFMAVLDEDEVRGLQGVKYFYVDEAKDISKEMVVMAEVLPHLMVAAAVPEVEFSLRSVVLCLLVVE